MTQPTDLPNVSMANTKKELLEAYEAAKKQFDRVNKDLLDAEKARQRMEKGGRGHSRFPGGAGPR